MTAAATLIEGLAAHGVTRTFCVPGESYLPVLDALRDRNDIQTITCRHESGAGLMAVADAKLTGTPGIAMVSRGPGAMNAALALHVAEQDAVPLILLIGQVPRDHLGRGAFQEVDYERTFGDIAKWIWTVQAGERMPEVIARAFAVAQAPTPGPVVVVLPEDMLEDGCDAPVVAPSPRAAAAPGAEDVRRVVRRLADAKRPLLIAGGGLADAEGRQALRAAADALGLPVAVTFKHQDIFPNAHPGYAGHLGFKIPQAALDRYLPADVVLAVGTRLGEVPTQGYRFPEAPVPGQPLIHVHDDPTQIGRVFATETGIVADPAAFLTALAREGEGSADGGAWQDWRAGLHDPLARQVPWQAPADGALDMGAVIAALNDHLADDAIVVTDAGNFASWVHRHIAFTGRQIMLGAVGGAMGIAVPAAVAAGLRAPGRQVLTFVGDGGMQMTGQELATAMRYRVPVKIFISNNGSYGTIRMHQERDFPGREMATELTNPDFAKLAESYGARGLTIARIEDAARVVAEAMAEPGPVVVDVRTALNHISAFATL